LEFTLSDRIPQPVRHFLGGSGMRESKGQLQLFSASTLFWSGRLLGNTQHGLPYFA
jgi:hypothetical protein